MQLKITCAGCSTRVRVPVLTRRGYTYKKIRVPSNDAKGVQNRDPNTGELVWQEITVQKNKSSGKQVTGPKYDECRPCYKTRMEERRPSRG